MRADAPDSVDVRPLGVLRALLRGHVVEMAVATAVAGIAGAAVLAQPLIAGRAVDQASSGGVSWQVVTLLVLAFAVVVLAEAADTYLFYRLGEAVVLDHRRAYATHLIALPVAELDRLRMGDLITRATADISELRELPRMAGRVVVGVTMLVVAAVLMTRIDALLAVTVLAVVGVSFFGGSLLLDKAGREAGARQRAIGEYGARLERTLGAIRTVKMHGACESHTEAIWDAAAAARRSGMRLAWLGAVSAPAMRMTATGSLIAVLVVGAARVSDGVISVGNLVTLFLLTLFSLAPLQDVYRGLTTLYTAAAAYARIEEVLSRPAERLDTIRPNAFGSGAEGPAVGRDVLLEAQRVSFSYADRRVLHDVSFQLRRNQVTAVVGQSGGGKSSLLALMCRFYEPDEGRFTLDGKPYPDWPLISLRQRIALVEQDNPVLHGSIRDNLTMGSPNASDDELRGALRKVGLEEFVDSLPMGLDTGVLDRGRALSGGQRQRIAIARALLSPAEVILLDEPTAHLDAATESALVETLLSQRERRSILIAAHRSSTIERADQILVIEHGRLNSVGTFAEMPQKSW